MIGRSKAVVVRAELLLIAGAPGSDDVIAPRAILTAAAANLRTLAPGVRQVEALAAELEAQQAEFDEAMERDRAEEAALRQLQRRVQPFDGRQGEATAAGVVKLTRGVRSVRVR